ncbi:hemerythrin domain-containing protein [Clostridium tetani]|uniref:hemerythrin domain-containing protein n=1 Tax=Clostridium tetani TaxID=1513 RepID=UPI000512A2B3|nr:hemerythrin domain-containing protein [Clostridium tetani]AVP54662.1 hemerythrin domain-containing protein [Clostridium tetani]KGI43261.1 hypothetical protein KY55_07395 [Clostridium tetani]RXI45562.1 hemerythrin domain-containing protein [Clostridium tetani]RXI51525.1 hemerythrin domain-containing protein [Clostridium tetani]RXI56178.1 hemerythrin domain-containing protein [Clostridium tetani]
MYIDNLKRQHIEICKIIEDINSLLCNIESNSSKISLNINLLSGKLKIHFQTEDKFLYPDLFNSEVSKIKTTAKSFVNEWGYLSSVFEDYKNKFNTKSKICSNISLFEKETKKIINALNDRINREEKDLYTLIG